jgi:hypothetical protein
MISASRTIGRVKTNWGRRSAPPIRFANAAQPYKFPAAFGRNKCSDASFGTIKGDADFESGLNLLVPTRVRRGKLRRARNPYLATQTHFTTLLITICADLRALTRPYLVRCVAKPQPEFSG